MPHFGCGVIEQNYC